MQRAVRFQSLTVRYGILITVLSGMALFALSAPRGHQEDRAVVVSRIAQLTIAPGLRWQSVIGSAAEAGLHTAQRAHFTLAKDRPAADHDLPVSGLPALGISNLPTFVKAGRTAPTPGPRLRIVVPVQQTPQEQAITQMLGEELTRRSPHSIPPSIRHDCLSPTANNDTIVLLADRAHVISLLPVSLRPSFRKMLLSLHPDEHPEAFSVVSLPWRGRELTVIAGNDTRGELFGAGWLLRHTDFSGSQPAIPEQVHIFASPEKPVRGHQIGYRAKNNTYDAWTLPQFEQAIRDLAIFGTNTIQLISPNSDDAASSPLFPAPALDTLLGISKILDKYGLDCDLYYPEMRKDYSNPEAVEAELRDFEKLVRAMPRLDALYVPGGDPGHTSPDLLLPLVAQQAEILHRYHPHATIWISAQGFDREQYGRFYELLDLQPAWLTGVFFGPQSRDSFPLQRSRIPARYAMQFYPDIAHTMHAQFPVPQWDPVYALTEGREPICPRPVAFHEIYKRFEGLHSGFITYSEGVNDDVNKFLWSQMGWSSKTPVDTTLAEYARLFLHREGAQQGLAVSAIYSLEADWTGPILENTHIPQTIAAFRKLEADATPLQVERNGQWESLLYRDVYDDYLQRKLRRQRGSEQAALAALGRADLNSGDRVALSRSLLAASQPDETEQAEHDELFRLGGELFHDYGLQLSVKLYGASNWERGANLDRVDTPLIQAAWLNHAMDRALLEATEAERLTALKNIVQWQHPVPGALYDDLGDPAQEPHLVRGLGWAQDPELYSTAIDGIADRTLADGWKLSWIDYAETLYETPLKLEYHDLDPRRSYRVRITYAGEDYALPLRLVANDNIEIHADRARQSNPETVEFPIPADAVSDGTLTLRWFGPQGSGGSGRGRQVAEVWLLPQ